MTVTKDKSPDHQMIARFCELFYGQGKIREAFETYVDVDYIQHNPNADNGREKAIGMLEGLHKAFPEFQADVKRIGIDGDLAFVHSHVRMSPEEAGLAVVDIFRILHGTIVEHWDVVQPVPAESANTNTMF